MVLKTPGNWMSPILAEIEHEMQTTMTLPAIQIVKPATLLVLNQYERFLDELQLLLKVHAASAKSQLAVLEGGPGRPLKQKESFGPISFRLISAVPGGNVQVEKASLITLNESNEPTDFGLKVKSVKKKADSVVLEAMCLDKGTKQSLAWFGVRAELSDGQVLEARVAEPFVVITNEKQWEDSLGMIVRHMLFDKGPTVSRARMCNAIQRAYLEGIREPDQADPKRPLSPADFAYMCTLRAIPDDRVSEEQFLSLWQWFGSALSRIRHNQTVLEMWSQGYIMGFCTRENAEALLINERPGSFLLRFSSQAPGLFAIAYTNPEGTAVKHYLMRKSDCNANISLARFLLEKPFFDTLLQTVPSFSTQAQWQRVPKAKALERWADKGGAGSEPAVPGYQKTLNIPFQSLTISK